MTEKIVEPQTKVTIPLLYWPQYMTIFDDPILNKFAPLLSQNQIHRLGLCDKL
jgi:hypothetical protein